MKKVWIASIFATLMLMVPFTNVIGASDTVEDCNCNPISDLQLVRTERLLDRLESRINFILLRYGHIPEVSEKCNEILANINLRPQAFELICDFLLIIYISFGVLIIILQEIASKFDLSGMIYLIFLSMYGSLFASLILIVFLRVSLDCEWPYLT